MCVKVCFPGIEYESQILNSHNQEHWQAVKQIICYLIGICNRIVLGNSGSTFDFFGYPDTHYFETRRLRKGFVVLLSDGPSCSYS